jgi:RNA polymerase sigma-B factor
MGSPLDPAAMERLLQQWEPLARRLAHRFAHSAEREDLEQIARLSLWQAAQRFDPARGCQFSTFAVPTVVGSLQHYLRDQRPEVHIPRRWWELRPHVIRMTDTLAQELGREPGIPELAERLDVSEEDVVGAKAVQDMLCPVSLDDLQEGQEGEGAEAVGARIGAIDPQFETLELRIVVRQAMERLPSHLRDILERRYFQGLSEQEVGRQLGVSQMQISRLERRALAWLREELREAFEDGAEGQGDAFARQTKPGWRAPLPRSHGERAAVA